jgi:hypothetical protein
MQFCAYSEGRGHFAVFRGNFVYQLISLLMSPL